MKLSIAIADTHALPSAFVVYRGFETSILKAARLGYHGVELALKRADEIHPDRLQALLNQSAMEVSCISTGQVYADGGLMLTHDDPRKRREGIALFREFIDLAAQFGQLVNIGRVRGPVNGRSRDYVEALFTDVAQELCAYAEPQGVTLILEPVNRYETDFINSVPDGVQLMERIGCPNMQLMPDVFHMNIEDTSIGPELSRYMEYVKYIHLADSNRLAPGQGHLDFLAIFREIQHAGYDGWVSVEILPLPTPDVAAQQAAEYLLPLVRAYNEQVLFTN
ncbi:TIM barrel protein [Larkinella sp. VNQ87]|uniref:TIM barrel protein n=1 Tax=Larkinella sp. VNQ87 TaxID=3400921 RepID=UPI003C0D321B